MLKYLDVQNVLKMCMHFAMNVYINCAVGTRCSWLCK